MKGGDGVMRILSLATGFKDEHAVAGQRQICGDRPASGARSHDDVIKLRVRQQFRLRHNGWHRGVSTKDSAANSRRATRLFQWRRLA